MPAPQIRINKTKELAMVLDALRTRYSLLNDAELIKLALSLAYEQTERQRRETWIASLPVMELSEEEQASLTEGIKSLEEDKKNGTLRSMSVEEIMEEIDRP